MFLEKTIRKLSVNIHDTWYNIYGDFAYTINNQKYQLKSDGPAESLITKVNKCHGNNLELQVNIREF